MQIKINRTDIPVFPSEFTVTTLDLDNGESTVRTADGTLSRDRIAVKRQIDMSWSALKWSEISALLQAMSAIFFDVYYPDPMTGQYETKTFYAGNRPAPVAIPKGNDIIWTGVNVTLTER